MKGINKKTLLLNILAMLVSRGTFMSMNPMGIGFFAAAYVERKTRLLLLISSIIGMATVLPLLALIKYSLIMILIVFIVALTQNKRKKKMGVPVMGLLASIITTTMSATQSMLTLDYKHYLILGALEGIVVFATTCIFSKGIEYILYSKKGEFLRNDQLISIAIIGAVVVYSIPRFDNIPFSFVETVVYLLILFLGYRFGSGAGAITGASCGLVLGLQNQGTGTITIFQLVGVYCILGVIAGVLREIGRIGTAVGFIAVTLTIGYIFENYMLEVGQLRALASAAILFLFLPKSFVGKLEMPTKEEIADEFIHKRVHNSTIDKLKDFSASFQKLSNTLRSLAQPKMSLTREDINDIFDDLSNKLCKDCSNCDICWRQDFYDTYKAAFSMLTSAEKNGSVSVDDIPEAFGNRCVHLGDFLAETNRSLEIAKVNLNWHNRMAESREAIAGQLGEVAAIISDFSLELNDTIEIEDSREEKIEKQLKSNHIDIKKISIMEKRNKHQEVYITARMEKGRCMTTREAASTISRILGKRMKPSDGTKNIISKDYDNLVFVEDTHFKVLTGMAKTTKAGERVSGDSFSFLPLETGEMILALSDGMGTGEKASEESESVVELLEQFMEAGFKEESALKLINSILVLKSEQQSFSTVDMSVINLFTGTCDFIKIGASTTFIKRDNWVETIKSTTLPIGVFNDLDYDGITKKLYDGDYIIMVTDGVLDCIEGINKEEIMEKIIMDNKNNNPQEIANFILDKALEQRAYQPIDDMTVLVAGVWKK